MISPIAVKARLEPLSLDVVRGKFKDQACSVSAFLHGIPLDPYS